MKMQSTKHKEKILKAPTRKKKLIIKGAATALLRSNKGGRRLASIFNRLTEALLPQNYTPSESTNNNGELTSTAHT